MIKIGIRQAGECDGNKERGAGAKAIFSFASEASRSHRVSDLSVLSRDQTSYVFLDQ